MQELETVSPREQEFASFVNFCLPGLYAEATPKYGVTIYLLDPEDVDCDDDLLTVSDEDTDMASVIYDNFNAAKVQDISEQLWSRLYRKVEEFVEENRELKAKEND